jgi:hypothetical protein
MSWEERLRQEWASARDDATRQYLLTIYQDQIASLPETARERLLESLQDTKRC